MVSKNFFKMTLELLKDYCINSQLHGLKFVAQEERHWSERVFWFICICASWYGCYLVIISSLEAFEHNALSFGTDTTYINWNTSLFAVSVCEDNNMDRVYDIVEELYGEDHDYNLDEVFKEITFFKGNSYYLKEFCFSGDLECPKGKFKDITAMIRSPCNETFEFCSWNDVEFDCCEYFQVLETELGPCFSLNSLQVKKPKHYPLISNRITGPGTLKMELWIPSNIYVHSPEDVPYMNTISTEFLQAQNALKKKRHYGITEIVNEKEVRDISVSDRRCRYPDENYLKSYKYYSYTACVVECRAKEQMRVCNCTSHLTPKAKDDQICDLKGLNCLNEHFPSYSVIINPWTNRQGLVCSCLPGCAEPEYDLVEQEEYGIDDVVAVIELSLDRLPSIRFKRSVVRGPLDLVVSMGGTAGLFVGASLLSFVELIYFFTLRIYGTLREKREKNKAKNGKNQKGYQGISSANLENSTNTSARNPAIPDKKVMNDPIAFLTSNQRYPTKYQPNFNRRPTLDYPYNPGSYYF